MYVRRGKENTFTEFTEASKRLGLGRKFGNCCKKTTRLDEEVEFVKSNFRRFFAAAKLSEISSFFTLTGAMKRGAKSRPRLRFGSRFDTGADSACQTNLAHR